MRNSAFIFLTFHFLCPVRSTDILMLQKGGVVLDIRKRLMPAASYVLHETPQA